MDENQRAIVDALLKCGAAVVSLANLGSGLPDLMVAIDRQIILVEVKSTRGTLTPAQDAFHRAWPVQVVRSVDDALRLVWHVRGATHSRVVEARFREIERCIRLR